MNYLFDTNAILYELKGSGISIDLKETDFLYYSFITKIELLSYAKLSKQERAAIDEFLSLLNVLYINEEIVQESIRIRKKNKLKLPDAIICATALTEDAVLVTADKEILKKSAQIKIKTKYAL